MEAAWSVIGLKCLCVVVVGADARAGAAGSKSQSEGRNNGALPPAEGEMINLTVSELPGTDAEFSALIQAEEVFDLEKCCHRVDALEDVMVSV